MRTTSAWTVGVASAALLLGACSTGSPAEERAGSSPSVSPAPGSVSRLTASRSRPSVWAAPVTCRVSGPAEGPSDLFVDDPLVRETLEIEHRLRDNGYSSLPHVLALAGDFEFEQETVEEIVAEMKDQLTRGGRFFLFILAIISVNLGFFNLLPIPILDGGHLLMYGLEGLRGRPLTERMPIRIPLTKTRRSSKSKRCRRRSCRASPWRWATRRIKCLAYTLNSPRVGWQCRSSRA